MQVAMEEYWWMWWCLGSEKMGEKVGGFVWSEMTWVGVWGNGDFLILYRGGVIMVRIFMGK